jgi:hypothetical protein
MQPWAGLMVLGVKKCETRSWNTKHRGQMAIHSSAKIPKEGKDLIDWLKANHPLFKDPTMCEFITTTGEILGHVNVVETHSTNGAIPDHWLERQLGNYDPDRWYWLCEKPTILGQRIKAKGKLSIWNFEPEIGSKP